MLAEVILTLFVSLATLYTWLYHIRPRLYLPGIEAIPISRPHWLLGTLPEMPPKGDVVWQYTQRRIARHGPVHRISILWLQQVQLCTPEALKVVMQSNTSLKKPDGGYYPIVPWLGRGLLLADGDRWKAKRRLLTPAFHFKVLQNYAEVNVEQTSVFLETLADYARKGDFFDAQAHVPALTLDIIMRTAFDCDSSAQKGDVAAAEYLTILNELAHAYFNMFQSGTILLPWWVFKTLTPSGRQYMAKIAKLHQFTRNVIQKRVEQNAKGQRPAKPYQDFLQMLLESKYEDGSELTMEDVRSEVDTFMFEGHDTTSSGVTWIIYCLAAHPEVQERVRAEVLSVLGSRSHPSHEDLAKFTYLTAAVKEALRVYPPVPFISRQLEEDLEICGHRVPKGAEVALSPFIVHYNPAVWPQPEKYDPERFMKEEPVTYSFVPFSAGARNCIGQVFAMNEMKMITAMVLRRFRLTADAARPPIVEPAVVMRSHNGVWVKVEELTK